MKPALNDSDPHRVEDRVRRDLGLYV